MSEKLVDPDLLLMELKRLNTNSYESWRRKAKKYAKAKVPETVVNYCLARAYVSDDGFYDYCHDILGYRDMYKGFHGPLCIHTVDPTHSYYSPDKKNPIEITLRRRYRMIQACRGSFKSSVSTVGYATWLIAREITLTDACNIRILIGSEVLALATAFVRGCKQVMESEPRWRELFGDHKGDIKGRSWSDTGLTSRFRTMARLREPTVSTIALDAPRAGFHYDVIIADDLETERASASREQIAKCWDFYRLLHSLLEPDGEMILVSTRWHYDDIYSRILKENEKDDEEHQYAVFIMPAEDAEGGLTFPTRFTRKHLDHLKIRHGSYLYSCQFLLNPVPDEDKTFQMDWIKLNPPDIWIRKDTKLRNFLAGDFAYTEQSRSTSGELKRADYTVLMVGAVDEYWNYYIREVFREKCTKLTAIEKMFDMFYSNQCQVCGLQRFDKSQVDDVIHQVGYRTRRRPNIEYISYPGMRGVGSQKNDRIATTLQPLMEAGKLHLLPGMDWLQAELMDFPLGAYDDGLDTLCNLVKVSHPPRGFKPKEKLSYIYKHIQALKKGRSRDLQGNYENDPDAWKRI